MALDHDVAEARPVCHRPELGSDFGGNVVMVSVGLAVEGANDQAAFFAIGLEINTGDELVAEEKREHVVTLDPFLPREVALDTIAESKEALRAVTLPDQRVEG